MNTIISYLYRDASNYKTGIEFVVAGVVDADVLMECCDEGEYFIPSQVGLQDIQSQLISFPSNYDHVWHELDRPETTEAEPTYHITADELMQSFLAAKGNWDVSKAMEVLGI